ncbi:MAG: M55 family metallopeptidase [Actinobacteria bacterium]|nr:M55 family metallopeptidase [Actinomycetota bacterium]
MVGSPKPLLMMEGLPADTGVALLVGYHGGPLDHGAGQTAIGNTAARTRHPVAAREAIRAGAVDATRAVHDGVLRPISVPTELVLEAELRPNGAAEQAVRVPGTERTGARTVRRSMRDPKELLDVIDVWASLVSAYLAS